MIDNNRWSVEQDAKLTKLWDLGWTASRIQEAMGLYSRSQVIGRAHRLKLPRRANPTEFRYPQAKKPKPLRLANNVVRLPVEKQPRTIPIKLGPVTKCRWPEGDPKHPDFHFCEEKTLPGRSYCCPHWLRSTQPKVAAE